MLSIGRLASRRGASTQRNLSKMRYRKNGKCGIWGGKLEGKNAPLEPEEARWKACAKRRANAQLPLVESEERVEECGARARMAEHEEGTPIDRGLPNAPAVQVDLDERKERVEAR